MGPIRRSVTSLAVVAIISAACGEAERSGSSDTTGGRGQETRPTAIGDPCAPLSTSISLVAFESETGQPPSFNRQCIAVPAAEPFTVKLRNKDFLEHNFSVFSDEDLSELLFRGDRFRGPGETLEYEVPAIDEPGTYTFVCDVHLTLMRGTLEVH